MRLSPLSPLNPLSFRPSVIFSVFLSHSHTSSFPPSSFLPPAHCPDRCFVLSFNEYNRYRAKLQSRLEAATLGHAALADSIQPPARSRFLPQSGTSSEKLGRRLREWRQPPDNIDPGLVFCCRKVFDFRQRRILKNPGA